MKKLILTTILVLMLSSWAFGADTIYVDKDIGASGDGSSWAQAKKTIAEGTALINEAGDIVEISGGTYAESISKNDGVDGTAEAWIVIKGSSEVGHNDSVIIDSGGGEGFDIRDDYVKVENFTVNGATDWQGGGAFWNQTYGWAYNITVTNSIIGFTTNSTNTTIEECNISGTTTDGVRSTSSGTSILNNSITTAGSSCVELNGATSATVSGNTLDTAADAVVYIINGSNNFDLDTNTILNGTGKGVHINASTGGTIHGGSIHDNGNAGVYAEVGSNNTEVYELSIYNNNNQNVYFSASTGCKVYGTSANPIQIYDSVTDSGVVFAAASNNGEVYWAVIHGNTHNINANASTGISVRNVILYSPTLSNIKFEVGSNNGSVSLSKIYDAAATHYGIQINASTGCSANSNSLYNNGYGIGVINGSTGATVKNNIVLSSIGIDLSVSADSVATSVLDYNDYYRASGNMITYGASTYTNAQFATYQTESSQDANSISADPLFVSATDFNLLPDSPAINAGTDPFSEGSGNQNDLSGRKVWDDNWNTPVGAWSDGVEIGAYGQSGYTTGGGANSISGGGSNTLVGF